SIPGKLNEGLADFDAFILIWSERAARSNWVRRELESAIHRVIEAGIGRVIPCCLDDTPLPPLIRDIRAENIRDPRGDIPLLVDSVLGFRARKDRLLAIQQAIDEMDFDWCAGRTFGPMICCPTCGAEKSLTVSDATDKRGDLYEVLRCKACGWSDANEI
ncbi:MAG: toll/interleukin-1 receptor domain-containing protein, partial [Candidatus Acidiferrales bacterium]